jgi:hypothetical protein
MSSRDPRKRRPGDSFNLPAGKHCSDCILCRECVTRDAALPEDETCYFGIGLFGVTHFLGVDPVTQRELDKMKLGADPCVLCIYKERMRALLTWGQQFEKETREIPVGTEDRERGASVYNWRSWFAQQIKSVLGLREGWR